MTANVLLNVGKILTPEIDRRLYPFYKCIIKKKTLTKQKKSHSRRSKDRQKERENRGGGHRLVSFLVLAHPADSIKNL